MVAHSLYNIVDRAFIGHYVGTLALGGLTATFPFMNLGAAFGAMVGVGACTVISVRLGQKDYATAQNVLGNAITLNVLLGTLFSIVCLAYLDPILLLFGASQATLPYAREYMQILLIFNVISHSYLGLNAILRAAGHPIAAMMLTVCSIIINAILDPIFIIGFDMGIKGAAIATVISQTVALAAVLHMFSRKDELLHLKRGIYHLKTSIVRQTLAIGMAPFLMNSCACLVVLLINRSMQEYGGDDALTAYGIVNSVVFCFLMVVMGLNQGMQPIAGYNWGGASELPCMAGVALHPGSRRSCDHVWFRHRRVHTRSAGLYLHFRQEDHQPRIAWFPHLRQRLPSGGRTDGDRQLFPEHRSRRQEHIPEHKPTDDIPDTVPPHPARIP